MKREIFISHLLPDEEIAELIRHYKVGVESIEFSISENLDHLDDCLASYEKRLCQMKCDNLALHGPFLDLNPAAFDSMIQKTTMHRFEQCYEAARVLGAKKIIYHSCYNPTVYFLEGWAPRVVDFFERFLENKSEDIEILMEYVMDPVPEPIAEIAEQISHPAFGLCLDVGHANCFSKISGEQWIDMLNSHIRHVHLHDNIGDRDSHLPLGKGTVPKEKLFAWLKSQTNVSCTIECNTQKDAMDSLTVLDQYSIMSTLK